MVWLRALNAAPVAARPSSEGSEDSHPSSEVVDPDGERPVRTVACVQPCASASQERSGVSVTVRQPGATWYFKRTG